MQSDAYSGKIERKIIRERGNADKLDKLKIRDVPKVYGKSCTANNRTR